MASREERDRIMAEYLASAQGDGDSDDEAEFQPGEEDEDEDNYDGTDDHDDDEDFGVWMKGKLSISDGRLVYKGHHLADGFELQSREQPIYWNIQVPTASNPQELQKPPRMRTLAMKGGIGKHHLTNVQFTLVIDAEGTVNGTKNTGTLEEAANAKQAVEDDGADSKIPAKSPASKTSGDDEDVDSKLPARPASNDANNGKHSARAEESLSVVTCRVMGSGSDASGEFEFHGTLTLSGDDNSKSFPLDCRKRTLETKTTTSSAVAAAAAAAPDEEDEDEDADEGVDYDELIALHQDAGLSLEEIRKRYSDEQANGGARKRTRRQSEQPMGEEDAEQDDESDEEYGF